MPTPPKATISKAKPADIAIKATETPESISFSVFNNGTKTNNDSDDLRPVSSSVSETHISTDVALKFNFATTDDDGTDIEITYGEIAKRLVDGDASFDDFVELLNQKLEYNNINVTASYDSTTGGFSFTNKKASADNQVYASLYNDGLGAGILNTLYDAASDDEKTALFNNGTAYLDLEATDGSVAQGTIKKGSENAQNISFDADGTYTQNGIVFTAVGEGKTTVTANPEKNIDISY